MYALIAVLAAAAVTACGSAPAASPTATPHLGIDLAGHSRLVVTPPPADALSGGPMTEDRADIFMSMRSLRASGSGFQLQDDQTTVGRVLGDADYVLTTTYVDSTGTRIDLQQSKSEFQVAPLTSTDIAPVPFAGFSALFWSDPYQQWVVLRPAPVQPDGPAILFVTVTPPSGHPPDRAVIEDFVNNLR